MDVRFINPVLETLMNVLGTMANMEPKIGKPSLKKNQDAMGDVTGFMSMESPQTRGSMAITFTRPVIFEIARRMLGAELTEIDDTARDLTGEMANMVVGGAKNILADKGFDFEMSLPTVLSGQPHEIKHNGDGQAIVLPFKAESGDFYIEICFEVSPHRVHIHCFVLSLLIYTYVMRYCFNPVKFILLLTDYNSGRKR